MQNFYFKQLSYSFHVILRTKRHFKTKLGGATQNKTEAEL